MLKKAMVAAALLLTATAASADPWKDESGNGRGYRYDDDRRDYYRRDRDGYDRYRRYSGIPRGHLPPPGMCRVWLHDRPPGQQPAPMSCRRARILAYQYGGQLIRGTRR